MKLDKEIRNDYLILKPYGRIDSNTSNEFEQAVQQAIEPGMNIEFDFREVVYISSSGLRVLLTLKKLLGNQINIRFSHVNDVIMDVFEMTGFTDLFEILRVSDDEVPDTRVIFFDIDGTLLSHSTGRIPESTIRAIKKVQETGVKCVIATGRDLVEMEKLPIHDIDFDGYLTLNGNICIDKDKKMFAGNEIAPDEVEVLVNIFKAGKIPFVLIGQEK
ncbi:MAG: HAD-IIB family hydrolase, partial [Erysipelotrichaceae bacterium]|nr:HAD-IIB family hydrolase [Erysipelotrichaceae bacterium]